METVGIFGGSGFTGSALTRLLQESGYRVVVFSRKPHVSPDSSLLYSTWNPQAKQIDAKAFASLNHVINLSGAGIADKRWTAARKKEILQSRTESTGFLAQCIKDIPNRIHTHINASAVGYYGADPNRYFTELNPASNDFLGKTCRAWEDSARPIESKTRLVIFRFGIVLGRAGGMLKAFEPAFAAHMAPVLGSGRQWISWIHLSDLCRLLLYAIQQPTVKGTYNAVAPQPSRQKSLIRHVAAAAKGWFIPAPAPAFVLKAALGEMSIELLKSCRVSAEKIQDAGFIFSFPDITTAAADLYR